MQDEVLVPEDETAELLPASASIRSRQRQRDAEQVEADHQVTVVTPCRPSKELLVAHLPAHPHSERMRHLRTEVMLRHSTPRNECLVMAVVGATAGEGRSVLAAELALSFAQLGRSTLLIDADLRQPRQHALFQVGLDVGLRQVLKRLNPAALLRVEGSPALSVLTAGQPVDQNPSELLSDGRFDALMGRLRNTFDYIIVDTPPFAAYTDAQVISTVVGHVLTVGRAGTSPLRMYRNMLRQLAPAGAQVLGAVVNHF